MKITSQEHLLERLQGIWGKGAEPPPPDYVHIQTFGERSDEYRSRN